MIAMRLAASTLFFAGSLQLTTLAYAQPAPPPPAPADEGDNVSEADKKRARALFDDAQQAMADGKIAEACVKFEMSNQIKPGIGTLFNLADCKEKIGKTGSAYTLFQEVAERTKSALQTDREAKARERMALLEPKLMKIRVAVPPGGRVKFIRVDKQEITPDNYNKGIVYDPGEHVVVSATPSDAGEPFEETIDLSKEGETVTVAIPVAPGAKMKRRVGMIVGGGITAAIGIVAGLGAIGLALNDGDTLGIALLGLTSVVCITVGTPIFAVGFKKKPVRGAEFEAPVFEASPIPELAIGPTGGSLTWRF